MRFAKYHGLGNDFLVVDLRAVSAAEAALAQDPQRVIALCDRQFGVGGDGVLAVLPSSVADARMRVLNSDGSEAEMCGNGLRCVAKELFDRGGLARPELAIETGAGVLPCAIEAEAGVARSVTVRMGAPRLLRGEIPMIGPAGERCIEQPLELPGETPRTARALTAVSMGNPHAVIFVPDAEAVKLADVGPVLERAPQFPRKVNVHFVQVHSPAEVTMRTWERGSGITLACGTGACSVCVAGVLSGRTGPKILAHLPGGDLELEWAGRGEPVYMTGPATEVFSGDWPD
jgi:diaminopimelate epimerase